MGGEVLRAHGGAHLLELTVGFPSLCPGRAVVQEVHKVPDVEKSGGRCAGTGET